jgi:lipopolysaccharide transport system permease protein
MYSMTPKTASHSAMYIRSHWRLLWRISISELRSRYAGFLLGPGWAVIFPILMISIYSVVYLVIFRVRVPTMSPFQYVLFIFSGLVPFLMTSEALSTGVGSIVVNKDVLNNTVFPIDLVPVKAVLMSQLTMIVGMMVILAGSALLHVISWTALLLPIIWLLHIMALIGVVWIISLINLLIRDIQNLVSLAIMVLMMASPIAYTSEMVPPSLKALILINPLAYFVLAYQHVLVLGSPPAWWNCLAIIVLAFGLFFVGGYFFSQAKRVMVDYV